MAAYYKRPKGSDMSTQPPEPPNENTVDELIDRIDELGERLAGIEEVLRLNAIEDRVRDLEEDANEDGNANNSMHEGEGQKALRLALAALLNNENMPKAASELVTTLGSTIKEWSGLKTRELQNQKAISLGIYFGGLGFSAFLLIILSALLWHDKITKELAAGLLGSLIGYWYGRDRPTG
jgi:hypothetical protein